MLLLNKFTLLFKSFETMQMITYLGEERGKPEY